MRRKLRPFLATLAFVLASIACDPGAGVPAPLNSFSFPSALVVLHPPSRPAGVLYVASSNFDLRFNAGTIIALDLATLDQQLAACTVSSPCSIPQLAPLLHPSSGVRIGSFIGDLVPGSRGDRLYAAIRSRPKLTAIDVDGEGALSCIGGRDAHDCVDNAGRARDRALTARTQTFPPDPTRLIVVPLNTIDPAYAVDSGDAIIISDRSGAATLAVDPVGTAPSVPDLVHVVRGISPGTISGAFDAQTGLVTFAQTATRDASGLGELSRVGIVLEPAATLTRSSLFTADPLFLFGFPTGADLRDIQFDPADATRAYVLARRPAGIISLDLSRRPRTPQDALGERVFPQPVGASRLLRVTVRGRPLLIASYFDSRVVTVVDPASGETLGVVRELSGPYSLAVDGERLFVGEFSSSTIRVLPLGAVLDGTPFAPVATIGISRVVRGLQ